MKTIKVKMEDLVCKTDNPIFDYCRKLIADGEDPDCRLEVYRGDNTEFDVAIPKIGDGARWVVDGNGVREYRPSHLKRAPKGGQGSLMRLNRVPGRVVAGRV